MSASFAWPQARERLLELRAVHQLESDRRTFVGPALRFVPPAVLPTITATDTPESWLARLSDTPGTQLVVLLRAGSAALGMSRDGDWVHHKTFKRYVVRGHGKAQTLHLKTRGKSRYGSRLRLQNARKLLEEVNERLRDWHDQATETEAIHWSCPVRQWPELFAATPPPPFAADDPRLRRITMHVHEPDFEELQRVWRALARGRIETG